MVETFGLLARDHEFNINDNIASKLDKEHIVDRTCRSVLQIRSCSWIVCRRTRIICMKAEIMKVLMMHMMHAIFNHAYNRHVLLIKLLLLRHMCENHAPQRPQRPLHTFPDLCELFQIFKTCTGVLRERRTSP
jgi:hypothetical protein